MKEYLNYVGQLCKDYRKKYRLSQEELAVVVGTNQSNISHVERGLVPLSVRWYLDLLTLIDDKKGD